MRSRFISDFVFYSRNQNRKRLQRRWTELFKVLLGKSEAKRKTDLMWTSDETNILAFQGTLMTEAPI